MTDCSAVMLQKEGPLLRVIFLEEGGAEEYPMLYHFHQHGSQHDPVDIKHMEPRF